MAITGTPIGRGIEFPRVGAQIGIPNPFIDSARGRSLHQKVSAKAARLTLQWHHANVMREHFGRQNRNKYNHQKRTKRWEFYKKLKFNSYVDIVASGKSRDRFLGVTPRATISRNQPDGTIHAYMRYRWPFPQANTTGGSRQGVTVGVMNDEVTRWTDADAQRAAKVYSEAFIKYYEQELTTRKKWRKTIGPVSMRV